MSGCGHAFPNAEEVERVASVLLTDGQSLSAISRASGVRQDRVGPALRSLKYQGRAVVQWDGKACRWAVNGRRRHNASKRTEDTCEGATSRHRAGRGQGTDTMMEERI